MKDFDTWNIKKQKVNTAGERNFFKERQIWWCSLGVNIGFEEDGKGDDFIRPILLLKKFSRYAILGVPLSTTSKRGPYYRSIGVVSGHNAVALLSQIRFYEIICLYRNLIRGLIPPECNTQTLFRQKNNPNHGGSGFESFQGA